MNPMQRAQRHERILHEDSGAIAEDGMLYRHKDPRPDLVDDHDRWVALLTTAKNDDASVWGILHGLRCAGARLNDVGGRIGMKIDYQPVLMAAGLQEELLRSQWLTPNIVKLRKLFASVRERKA